MAKPSNGPRYYESKRAYVANFRRKRHYLLKNVDKTRESEREAKRLYDKLKAATSTEIEGDRSPVWAICNAYLANAKTRTIPAPLAPNTFDMHKKAIEDFCNWAFQPNKLIGELEYRQLTMKHVNDWVAARKQEKKWAPNFVNLRLRILRTVTKWAANEGGLVSESVFGRKGKTARLPSEDLTIKRLAIKKEEHEAILARVDRRKAGNFGGLLRLLWATGARPAELYMVRADEWSTELKAFVIDPTDPRTIGRLKTRRKLIKQGRKRIIRVPDDLVPMVNELVGKANADGMVFRTENGKPWAKQSSADRLRKIVARVEKRAKKKDVPCPVRHGLTPYSYRHAFVTRWLTAGRNPMKLCELIDTSIEMLQKHYSHLFEDHKAISDELNSFNDLAN